jgi:hypothetical protein
MIWYCLAHHSFWLFWLTPLGILRERRGGAEDIINFKLGSESVLPANSLEKDSQVHQNLPPEIDKPILMSQIIRGT